MGQKKFFARSSQFFLVRRLYRILPFYGNIPSGRFSTSNHNVTKSIEEDLCNDIFKFYNTIKETGDFFALQEGVWQGIIGRQDKLHNILENNNSGELIKYLNNAPNQPISRGILQGDLETNILKKYKNYRLLQSRITFRRIESLLESQGYKSSLNPEQGPWRSLGVQELSNLISKFEKDIGYSINVPDIFSDLFEIQLGQYHFNQVDIASLNASLNIKKYLPQEAIQNILEIGGGSGRFAYYNLKSGNSSIQIIDFPHVLILQYWFLSKALPEAKITFFNSINNSKFDATLIPVSSFKNVNLGSVDVVFNQDSFAEMPLKIVLDYVNWLSTRSNLFIISINHESQPLLNSSNDRQINFFEILLRDLRFELVSRELDWIRRGYVKSIFQVKMAKTSEL
jgi:hypothetical protein